MLKLPSLLAVALLGLSGLVAAAPAPAECVGPVCGSASWVQPEPASAYDSSKHCDSNGECLRKGLPLKKPSKARRAALPRRSSIPEQLTARVAMYDENNVFKGYMPYSTENFVPGPTTDPAQALIITTLTDVPDTTFTIDTSQQVSGYPYLCGFYNNGNNNPTYGWFTTCSAKSESAPVTGTNRYNSAQPALTGMFTVDGSTLDVRVSYKQPSDGATVQQTLFRGNGYTGWAGYVSATSYGTRVFAKLVPI